MPNDQTTTFLVDQRVVYPSQGVGRIMEIREKTFNNQKTLYYIIYLEFSDMTVMVPVDKVEVLGIRPLVSERRLRWRWIRYLKPRPLSPRIGNLDIR